MTLIMIGLVLVAVFLALCYAVYRFGFYSPKGRQNDDRAIASTPQTQERREEILRLIDAAAALPYETVQIRSRDGLTLFGRYYHRRQGAPLDLCFHGYRGTPVRDFSGGIQVMLRRGHNVLMVEQRAHCRSQGHTICFGIEERFDCLDWLQYAQSRFGPDIPIFLVGVSMGAATVLMASGLDLPGQVAGIVADCPYSAPKAIIAKVCGDMKLPVRCALPLASVSAKLFGRFDLGAASAVEAVRHASVPILLIHGEEDRFVPCAMSREIRAANPDHIELQLFPGAGHGLSCLVDPTRYERLIGSFMSRTLPR